VLNEHVLLLWQNKTHAQNTLINFERGENLNKS